MAETWISYNAKTLLYNSKTIGYLPPYTLLLRMTADSSGTTPFTGNIYLNGEKGTLAAVDKSQGLWTWTYANSDWSSSNSRRCFRVHMSSGSAFVSVIGNGDLSGVTDMFTMFSDSNTVRIRSVELYGTGNVTTMKGLFMNSGNYLTSVRIHDISSVEDLSGAFADRTALSDLLLENSSSALVTTREMFQYCESLSSFPLLNTHNVTDMANMFDGCISMTSVPLIDTSSVQNMDSMFYNCYNVQSGALALYQQASVQPTVLYHDYCFYNCGSNTTTGAAELAQIPSDWK